MRVDWHLKGKGIFGSHEVTSTFLFFFPPLLLCVSCLWHFMLVAKLVRLSISEMTKRWDCFGRAWDSSSCYGLVGSCAGMQSFIDSQYPNRPSMMQVNPPAMPSHRRGDASRMIKRFVVIETFFSIILTCLKRILWPFVFPAAPFILLARFDFLFFFQIQFSTKNVFPLPRAPSMFVCCCLCLPAEQTSSPESERWNNQKGPRPPLVHPITTSSMMR